MNFEIFAHRPRWDDRPVTPAQLKTRVWRIAKLGNKLRPILTSRHALCLAGGAVVGTLIPVAVEGLGASTIGAAVAG